jgi:hypothetical protein
MTITIKLTDRPVVKSTNPELYVNHTYHMKRAIKYTYNYSAVDDYIVQNWRKSTAKRMAGDLNEYQQRIEYRIQVLKSVGLLGSKNNMERGKLVKEYKVLMTQAKAIKLKLEA